LSSIGPDRGDNNLFDNLSKYVIMTKLDDNAIANYKILAPDGSDGLSKEDFDGCCYQLKDGSVMCNYDDENLFNGKSPYTSSFAQITYDINGLSGNNIAGKEVFAFNIDNTGIMVPYASTAYSYATDGDAKPENCKMSDSNVFSGLACTGKIADNGWKADY
jgi:hypothetical protein